jgi:Uma2 family endonuclease
MQRAVAYESCEWFTQEEFAAQMEELDPRDINRYELLNGRIVMTPPAGWPHGRAEVSIAARIEYHVVARRLGTVVGSSQGFELPSGDTVEPDAAYMSNERWSKGPAPEVGKFLRIVPDLVVEVISPSTASRDRGEKKAIYERNAVREYWLVDHRQRRVTRFVLEGERFDHGTAFDEGDTLTSVVLPGLEIPVRDVIPP